MYLNRCVLSAFLVCALIFSTFETPRARSLKGIEVECCDDGFKLDSSFLTIDIKKGDVKIESALGDAHFTGEGTVIDSPLLKVNTLERVRVEVADGEILNVTTTDDGSLDLTIGKDGAVATLFIEADGKGVGRVGEEEIVVDFSDKDGGILVDVGENGKIVDVDTDGEGNGRVRVGENGKIAKLDVSGKDFKLVLGEDDDESDDTAEKDGEDGNKEEVSKDEKKEKEKKNATETDDEEKTDKTETAAKTKKKTNDGEDGGETGGEGGKPGEDGEDGGETGGEVGKAGEDVEDSGETGGEGGKAGEDGEDGGDDEESVAIVRLMGTKVIKADVEEI